MRMAQAFPQGLTAVVPDAQVIHARAGSALRNAAAAPLNLHVQGRSTALFARRHGGAPPAGMYLHRMRRQMIRAMLDGQMDPLRVAPVMATLEAGLRDGQRLALPDPPPPRADQPAAFRRMSGAPMTAPRSAAGTGRRMRCAPGPRICWPRAGFRPSSC